jgi:hypothetical protein
VKPLLSPLIFKSGFVVVGAVELSVRVSVIRAQRQNPQG